MEKQESKTDIQTHLFKFTAEEERRMARAKCAALLFFMQKYGRGRKPRAHYSLVDREHPLF